VPDAHPGQDQRVQRVQRGRRVWIVGTDHWPRAYLRAELIERGHDAVGFVTLRDAALALSLNRSRAPDALVVDLQDQPPSPPAIAALTREHIPIIAVAGLTPWTPGGATEPRWSALLHRPLTIGTIADTVDRLLARSRVR